MKDDGGGKFSQKKSFGKQMGLQSKIRDMREKMMMRDNWNCFVGDADYKTDAVLRFKEKHIKYQYEKFLLASSAYSLRVMLSIMAIASLWISESQGVAPKNFDLPLAKYNSTEAINLENMTE